MNALDRIRDEVAALRRRFDTESTTLRLGTYQADGSVLQPDGAEVIPAAVLAFVEPGDTVLVGHYLRRAWVLGKVSPDGPPDPYEPPTPTMRLQSGQVSVSMTTTWKDGSVTFPTAFASAPRVFLQIAEDNTDIYAFVDGVTTTGFDYVVRKTATGSDTVPLNWLAVPNGSLTL